MAVIGVVNFKIFTYAIPWRYSIPLWKLAVYSCNKWMDKISVGTIA